MDPKVTITDVAKEAGVALGTASRVLNNHPSVNQEARLRVLEAAKRLNYVRLRKRRASQHDDLGDPERKGSVGVVIFGLDQVFVDQPVTSEAFKGIEHQLARFGRSMQMANVPELDHVPAFINEGGVDGLILRGPFGGDLPKASENSFIDSIHRYPSVWLFAKPPGWQGDIITYDPAQTCNLVLRHFSALGHQRIGFFNIRPGSTVQERLKTHFLAESSKYGLNVAVYEGVSSSWKIQLPRPNIDLVKDLEPFVAEWETTPEDVRPTGWFIGSDYVVAQTYKILERRGIRVGEDISIVSCNYERKLIEPLGLSLTSVNIGAELMGQRAVDQLLWRLDNPGFHPSLNVMVEPRLMIGDSVKDMK